MKTSDLPSVSPQQMAASASGLDGADHPSLIVVATADHTDESQEHIVGRARAFAEPLLSPAALETGENTLAHADAMAGILAGIGASKTMQAASYIIYASEHLNRPEEVIGKAFGAGMATLAVEANRLVHVQRQARHKAHQHHKLPHAPTSGKAPVSELAASQTENVRKMLLAFSRDLRVVMLRLASRLQTLRYHAELKQTPSLAIASESLHVFAPLANRLGIWQIKWELEDLAFRFLEPQMYKQIAKLLDEKRTEREAYMAHLRQLFEQSLHQQGIESVVQGRPKHIYSIARKMQGKALDFSRVFDIRALRVVVPSVEACYSALAWVHDRFKPVSQEFDDYIANPKINGYQSLHTVVLDDQDKAIEVQIRTQTMHEHAEHGVAAHWAYKEAGTKGYAGVSAASDYDAKIAVLRQLLAWERDLSGNQEALFDDRIYVLTPEAAIVDLPKGATPLDFAYAVHTTLGHRCRGAKIDGAMVPLSTELANGQTIEILVAKEGGPSRDWLNPELKYLVSTRAKSKVRAWFNGLALETTIAKGREIIEKLLQREGKTALRLEDLANQMGFDSSAQLFEVVGKDELSLRAIETHINPPEPECVDEASIQSNFVRKPRLSDKQSGSHALVVGVDSMLTQLSKCCKPAPPDAIGGFVAKGKGVSIHRSDCTDFRYLQRTHPDRVIDVQWRHVKNPGITFYPVDVAIRANDRQGLLRDISDVFTREKINVIGVNTQSSKGEANMVFTIEISESNRLQRVLATIADIDGVRATHRRGGGRV